ncbi:formate--tetrahydrofolate ligase [Boudabousia tangfeifanii]|uniref:Formate--tetrahydrofolate ligase n=1 Tax=Boudabousia tangfeifanii TaxID=1912795 RepID=A0A1D9MKC4_9ACTO|nr:formate--tetrahydrofolate ligase [Boudabousia tangfeifanii]AOZ72764.1 formate--tetrahydrofolate ligase [Boudabousia tangfeifanii]
MLSDIEIARQCKMREIDEVAKDLSLAATEVEPYGRYKAKVNVGKLSQERQGKVVLVTAVSPTPAGEGKTTTSVGLADALALRGKKAMLCLREPSMGPVFGMKGGAAGGGYAQVVPMEDINLNFTGDFAAIALAHNLLAAMIDNHLHHGNELRLDARQIWWKRVVDMNDRALRQISVGLGGPLNGFVREDGFDIVAASEIMAIVCLASDLADLRSRLGKIVVGLDLDKNPVTCEQIGAAGAMAVILKDVLGPNLVQTLEGNPAFVHGGPFANIAHGCSTLTATHAAQKLADIVVTEAGFGADLGAEKFFDIKCRAGQIQPTAVVCVATIRSIKYNAGVARPDLDQPNIEAVQAGAVNLLRHVENLQEVFGQQVLVALNRFAADTDEEIAALRELVPVPVVVSTHFANGGEGALELADAVLEMLEAPTPELRHAYELTDSYEQKALDLAKRVYRASEVTWSPGAKRRLGIIAAAGYENLPICVAKNQYSFSADPKALGAPSGHTLHIREVRLSAGAGFIVLVAGDMMTMPGLPKQPAALGMEVDADGNIIGLS